MITYKEAGVDIDAGNKFVETIKPIIKSTLSMNALGGIGSFAGAFRLPKGYKNPVLLASTDGVGTKLRLAIDSGRLDTIGIDLVAMCVNDLICNFGTPLFFLDYYATAKLDIDMAKAVIEGIVKGCKSANCSLIGGETAEMRGIYQNGDFDIAGFAVGIAEEDEIDRSKFVKNGDILVALPSTGLHSNGYSLARAVLDKMGINLEKTRENDTFLDAFLAPTRIYVDEFISLKSVISALAHITGGGIVENLPRVLPEGLGARVDRASIKMPEIFKLLMDHVSRDEMDRTFNCGVGMILVVSKENVDYVLSKCDGYVIGSVVSGSGVKLV